MDNFYFIIVKIALTAWIIVGPFANGIGILNYISMVLLNLLCLKLMKRILRILFEILLEINLNLVFIR